MNNKNISFVLFTLFSFLTVKIFCQNFNVSTLIDIPGNNIEFDVLSPSFAELGGETFVCWINKIDSIYSVYLKQISPVVSDNILVSKGSGVKSNPLIAINRYSQGIKIVWQCKENNFWQVYLKNYMSGQLSDSTLLLDSLDTDPQISLSVHRLAWINNGNLFVKEFYPEFSTSSILFDSLECSSPNLLMGDGLQETAILYEKNYTDSVKIFLTTYQHNENKSPVFNTSCLSAGVLNKRPRFGLESNVAFQKFQNGVWKSEYYEYYWWEGYSVITPNTSCNYYNPILFTYPIPTSAQNNFTPFFLAFDTDSIADNEEIFIKEFTYGGLYDSLLNISQSEGNDFKPKLTYLSYLDSMMVAIIWLHNENDKTDIWIAKEKFNPVVGDVAGENYSVNSFKLFQNYPNPFNPETTIEYTLHKSGNVKIVIYNFLGEEVVTLVNEYKNVGDYKEVFWGRNLSSGIYFYRLFSGNKFESKSMVLLK